MVFAFAQSIGTKFWLKAKVDQILFPDCHRQSHGVGTKTSPRKQEFVCIPKRRGKFGKRTKKGYKQLSGMMTPVVVPPVFLQNDCAFLFK